MGRIFQYFPPPPPVCEELSWHDLPRSKYHHVTKLEPVEQDNMVVHCNRGDTDFVIFECPFDFLRKLRRILRPRIDHSHRQVFFMKVSNSFTILS